MYTVNGVDCSLQLFVKEGFGMITDVLCIVVNSHCGCRCSDVCNIQIFVVCAINLIQSNIGYVSRTWFLITMYMYMSVWNIPYHEECHRSLS